MAILESRTKTAMSWVTDSLALLKLAPRKWMLLALAYVGVFMMLPSIPGLQIFAFVTILIWPVFIALAMRLYQTVDQEKTEDLAAAIKIIQPKVRDLVLLGLSCLAYGVLISLILSGDMESLAAVAQEKAGQMTEQQVAAMLNGMVPVFLKLILFLIPLIMATWFAPMLIAFNQYSLIKSIKSSVAGSIQYMITMSLSWLVLTAIIIGILLVLGLIAGIIGSVMPAAAQFMMSVLVFGILLFASALMLAFQYVSYRDIFKAAPFVEAAV